MNAVKQIFGSSPSMMDFLSSAGPLSLALLFIVLSYGLAWFAKKSSASFLKLFLNEKSALSATRWSKIIFWIVFVGSILLLGGFLYNTMSIEFASNSATQKFGAYFSRFVSALFIITLGISLGSLAKRLTTNALAHLHYRSANTIGRVAGIFLASLFAVVAIEQLNINFDLIRNLILIAALVVGISFSFSLGFGSKKYSANIICGNHIRRTYTPGLQVSIGDVSGVILSVDAVATMIETENNCRVVIPNEHMMSAVVIIHPPKDNGKKS